MFNFDFYPIKNKISLEFSINNDNINQTKREISELKSLIKLNDDKGLYCNLGIEFGKSGFFKKSTKSFHYYFLNSSQHRWMRKLWTGQNEYFHLFQYPQYGETFFNFFWLPMLNESGKNYSFVCKSNIANLLRFTGLCDSVIASDSDDIYSKIDTCKELFSFASPSPHALAHYLKIKSIKFPFFAINTAHLNRFRFKYNINMNKFRLGICWKSGIKGSDRNININHFNSLSKINNLEIISLQKGPVNKSVYYSKLESNLIHGQQMLDKNMDFYETLLAICNCSLIITCDTSVAHLAGLSGIPTILVLNTEHDNRWGTSSNYPIYPNLRILRKKENESFTILFERLTGEIISHYKLTKHFDVN